MPPILASALLLGALAFLAPLALAGPYIWDAGGNHIDDRMETVNALGYRFAFENQDTTERERIDVVRGQNGLLYGAYVVFDHEPSNADLFALTSLGMPILFHYVNWPAVRTVANFVQIQAAAALPGIERIEAIPALYPDTREENAAIGVRDASSAIFPTAANLGTPAGEGVVVAILDTGVNDAPDGSYPGHESLLGKFVGGASFIGADSTLYTGRNASVNPVDHGGTVTQSHATHVAGIVMGTGGPSGYAMGVAPAAKLVDVKVLDDTGTGTAVPEALDWCISNRSRDWGAGPDYRGIDVINLSLASLDQSDGNDLAARLANKAAQLGIVVVAAVGNDGKANSIPSPAAGNDVLAVGAYDAQRTGLSPDDLYASFNNYGPRADNQNGWGGDEQKPDLLAPGVGILSADGNVSSDGTQYQRLTGTSMAAAFVSGVAAVLKSVNPSYAPIQIAELLRSTAHRYLSTPPSVGGPDPRWSSTIGYGAVDLYAALLEVAQPNRSQVRRFSLASTPTAVNATLWTQREMGAANFVFERAPDVSGTPGVFTPYDSVAAAGNGSLADVTNLQSYPFTWSVPQQERGQTFWYRVSYSEGGVRYDTPALRYEDPMGQSIATLEVTIVHNAYDSDIDARVLVGGQNSVIGDPESDLVFPIPATTAAVSSDWVSGSSTTGNVAWTFRVEVPAGPASAYLPPSGSHPWTLLVTDGGYLNRSGRITSYRLIEHGPGGDVVDEGGPVPELTIEGQTVGLAIPQGTVAVEPSRSTLGLRYGPNPVGAGGAVEFARAAATTDDLHVFDLAGREVGRVPFVLGNGGWRAHWSARDAAGQPLPSGLYFARAGEGVTARLVVIAR